MMVEPTECRDAHDYYVGAEALNNAAKYARASKVSVCAKLRAPGFVCRLPTTASVELIPATAQDSLGSQTASKRSAVICRSAAPPGSGTSLHAAIPLA